MMNRVNWIQYLKMVYDQLEKIQVAEEPPRNLQNHRSFLSINTRSSKEPGAASSNRPNVRYIEKVSRDQFAKALQKVMSLLPLISEKEYEYRYPSEKGISFEQVYNHFMACSYRELTWDKIIELLVIINIDERA